MPAIIITRSDWIPVQGRFGAGVLAEDLSGAGSPLPQTLIHTAIPRFTNNPVAAPPDS